MNALDTGASTQLGELERRLLDEFQRDLPLTPRPYADMAGRLGCSERQVIETLESLRARGLVSRVGLVLGAGRVGESALAALSVPDSRIEEVAALISSYPEVNHNYAREHVYNLWFVVVAADATRLREVLDGIRARTGYDVMELPLERAYHIDLGFPLWR